MKTLAKLLKKFVSDEKGLETVEYAVMGAMITAAVVVTIGLLGSQINTAFQDLINHMQGK